MVFQLFFNGFFLHSVGAQRDQSSPKTRSSHKKTLFCSESFWRPAVIAGSSYTSRSEVVKSVRVTFMPRLCSTRLTDAVKSRMLRFDKEAVFSGVGLASLRLVASTGGA